MFGARAIVALALSCALLPALPRPVAADAPVPLDYKAYDGWNAIHAMKLSDDGRVMAYALAPEDGDPTLVVRDLTSGAERREPRGDAPAFAAGSRFVVFTHVAAKADVDAAKRAKKPESQQPKNGAAILDLQAPAHAEVVDNIKTIAVPKDGGAVIAYLAEPPASPSPSPSAAPPSSPPSPSPDASPSPSASPTPAPKADKTKETGSLLTIRDLAAGKRSTAPNATGVVVSDDDRFIAYSTETKDGKGDGVHVYDVARGTTADVLTGNGRYRQLALARNGSALAFLSDAATYAQDVPHDALYVADLTAAAPAAVRAADISDGMTPNANGALTFTKDGKRVFYGAAAAPTPQPSATPEPMKVDIWTSHDDVLQSQQKHDADRERKRTYLGVYDLAQHRAAQLGSPTLPDMLRNENPTVALGVDDRAYRRATSWRGQDYADLYAVSLASGERRLLARDVPIERPDPLPVMLSPAGRYVLGWDERAKHWFTVDTQTRRRVTLGVHADVAFHEVEDDHPAPPPPYGVGGWLADDRGVLLYDRYDIWLADPATGTATNFTHAAGRRAHIVYSAVQTDHDADAFPVDRPLLVSERDDRTYATGFARVVPGGGVPVSLLHVDAALDHVGSLFKNPHDRISAPWVARHADRVLFTRETFREAPNVWSTDGAFHNPVQVSDENPQQAKYRWGSERVIDFKGKDGTPLRALMYIPDGLRPTRSAPMLVYFYETWAQTMHSYYKPAPGTSPNFPRYVSNGYVMLFPDVQYRPGHPGASAENAILPAVDAALRTGFVDPSRVGIAGHSWAAYQINYLLTRTHRFRAAEAGAAVDDMVSAYSGIRLESGVVRESQYERGQSRIGATPWDRPDLYFENSGLFRIRAITTPYLTIHNDQDGAVPQFQGIEFVTAMRRLGKEAYLFSFDGEDHNLRGREQQKWWTVHLDEWFDHWLKGAPRPSWMNGVDYLHRGERDIHPLYGEPSPR